MKRIGFPLKGIASKAGLALTAVLMTVLAGCSGGVEEDVEMMFGTVPADAPFVYTVNLEETIDQTGGKVSGNEVKDFGALEEVLKSAGAYDKKVASGLEELKEVLKGVKLTAAAGFYYQGEAYFTAILSDVDAFREGVDNMKDAKGEWQEEEGLLVKEGFAIADDRLWFSSRNTPDTEKIRNFMSLSETESFKSNEYAAKMAKSDDAMNFWGSLDALMSNGLSFSEQTQAKMALSMMFSQPKYLVGSGNFSKDGTELDVSLLNAELKPAKCELEVSEIDTKVVAGLGGNADMVMAMSVSQKLVKQIVDFGASLGGALPPNFKDFISPIDGTLAFATPSPSMGASSAMGNFRGVVSTNGKENAQLAQALGAFSKVDIDGTTLKLSQGRYGEGEFSVAEVAKEFKDAWLGVAYCSKQGSTPMKGLLLLEPADGSLRLRMKISLAN